MRLLESILRLLKPPVKDGVRVRFRQYRDRLDLTHKPLIMLSGASVASARELIPFLVSSSEMGTSVVDRADIVAYNGEEADEIHAFQNVTQGGSHLSRILVREGRIIELTIKG